MSRLRRSVSAPSLDDASENDEHGKAEEGKLDRISFVQKQMRIILGAAELKEKEKAVSKQKADVEQNAVAVRNRNTTARSQVSQLEKIKGRVDLLDEFEIVCKDFENKMDETHVDSIKLLTEVLKERYSELQMRNLLFKEVETAPTIIADICKNLTKMCKLERNGSCIVSKLASLILEKEQVALKVQNSSGNCSLSEKKLMELISQHNGKKCMLNTKKRYNTRRRSERTR